MIFKERFPSEIVSFLEWMNEWVEEGEIGCLGRMREMRKNPKVYMFQKKGLRYKLVKNCVFDFATKRIFFMTQVTKTFLMIKNDFCFRDRTGSSVGWLFE